MDAQSNLQVVQQFQRRRVRIAGGEADDRLPPEDLTAKDWIDVGWPSLEVSPLT